MLSKDLESSARDGAPLQGWDFEHAIDLIRLQTESILQIQEYQLPHLEQRDGSTDSPRMRRDLIAPRRPLLGDFDGIFRYLEQSSHTDRRSFDAAFLEYRGSRDDDYPTRISTIFGTEHQLDDGSVSFQYTCSPTFPACSANWEDGRASTSERHTARGMRQTQGRETPQSQPQNRSSSISNAVEFEAIRAIDSRERRKIIQGFTGSADATPDATTANNLKNTGKSHLGAHFEFSTKQSKRSITALAGPQRRLQIMRMLGMETSGTIGSMNPSLPHDTPNSLALLPLQVKPEHRIMNSGIHVFVDLSNILIGFHDTLKRLRGLPVQTRIPRVPLSFFNLALILERGRPVAKAVLAGSDMLESVEEARQMGYEINLLERVLKHKENRFLRFRQGNQPTEGTSAESENEALHPVRRVEQGVDEILHLKMCQSVLDHDLPGTIVLATGDAAEAEYSDGFLRMVERALSRGWKVELVSFQENMSSAYLNTLWVRKWHGAFTTIVLDRFAKLLRLE